MTPSATAARHRTATAMFARAAALGTAAMATAALAAACGSVTPNSGAAAPASPSGAHTSGAATAAPNGTAGASLAGCATSALKVTVNIAKSNGAAGSIYYPLDFTNASGSTCTLLGYPGVSFVTGNPGTLMGRAATRNPVAPSATVTLTPGQVAHATLQVAEAGNYTPSQCKPVTAHWLRVFPPDQAAALDIPFTTQACSARLPHDVGSQLSVSVIQPGAG
jgi:Domain of unknown function (DUF4232)